MNKLEQNTQIYLDTAQAFVDLVDRIPVSSYDAEGLGRWTVIELIGHAGRALRTVLDYAAHPATSIECHTPSAYIHSSRKAHTPEEIYERGVRAAAGLRDGAAAPLRSLLADVTALLDELETDETAGDGDSGPVIATPVGGIRLATYLSTRILELCIHSFDLTAATGATVDLPADALRITLQVEADLAVLDGVGPDVVQTLAGRRSLPASFSVIQ